MTLFLYQPKGHEKVSHVLFDIQRVIGITITYSLEQNQGCSNTKGTLKTRLHIFLADRLTRGSHFFDKNKFKQNYYRL